MPSPVALQLSCLFPEAAGHAGFRLPSAARAGHLAQHTWPVGLTAQQGEGLSPEHTALPC